MTRGKGCDHCPGSHTGERPALASATAKARGWLLLEHPGPWPERVEQLIGPGPMAETVRAALAEGVRPQLIRRTGRRRAIPPLQVYAGFSQGGNVWMEGRELADPAELAGLDLAAVAAGRRPGFGEPVTEPVFLVCTHGRRNVCCARTGAPLARGLAERFGDLVWETTHVGGDRYAANMVCLPHGIYYGDLGLAAALDAAGGYLRGEVALAHLRGRAGVPEPAQAAEHFVRAHTGLLGVDAVTARSVTGTSPYEAVVLAQNARFRVVFERVTQDDPCGTECQENLGTYIVRELTLLNEAALV
ncbi:MULTISPECIES: sucrase ferredoxin [Thermomonosporaceae]|uniref:sucrase ferredoxin n=1 Tax=Thermomonosporaceae TaxID=2012 RepID=UPI00255AEDD2|nr:MULTISPECIES: sucrase ferredoxin [Thermomonosporaceae]MDL4774752.1 sucrase ferredoxin [Actinomadura xylanilytica]